MTSAATAADARSHRSARGPAVDAAALFVLALAVNFTHLGTKSFWLDEATSVEYVYGLRALVPIVTGEDPNMGLFYVTLNLWRRLSGDGEAALRSLSAIAAALAVSTTCLIGTRLFGRRVGLLAGVALALDAFVVKYAQTVRGYGLMLFLATLACWFFIRALDDDRPRFRIGYVLAGTAAVYSHYFAVLVLGSHALTLLAIRRREALRWRWLSVAASLGVLLAPEVLFAHRADIGNLSWIAPPSLSLIPQVLIDFAGWSNGALAVLATGALFAIISATRSAEKWREGFLASWLLVPVVVAFGVSYLTPVFESHYLIACVPALALLGAAGIERVRLTWLRRAAIAALLVTESTTLLGWYRQPAWEQWREATRFVASAARPGDGLVFFPFYARAPFDYYVRRTGVTPPRLLEAAPPGETTRVWLLIRKSDQAGRPLELQRTNAWLAPAFHRVDHRDFGDVGVELFTR